MRYSYPDDWEPVTTQEAFEALRVDDLKRLARLLSKDVPNRKADLVALLTKKMQDPDEVRTLYEQLDETGKNMVREATHAEEGLWHPEQFRAKYGQAPSFGAAQSSYHDRTPPSIRWLFFPNFTSLPVDLHQLLLKFVPEPKPLAIAATEERPTTVRLTDYTWQDGKQVKVEEEVPLRLRETARDALHDVQAVLRLVDAGDVRVGEKTRRPTQGTVKAVSRVLAGGDFYSLEDESKVEYEQVANDLTMKAFAWPLLLQAAGLAEPAGARLQLTEAGRKATTKPPAETLQRIWNRWLGSKLLDEFSRVNIIKGQQSSGALSAVVPRRKAVADVLAHCPPRKWIAVDEFFRYCQALGADVEVARNPWKLYITDSHYGSFGYEGHTWEELSGRFILAFLFEYAATLGLLDVAYIGPEGARSDFANRWGADDLGALSRYDGLMFLRINALGAWCLGITEQYEAEAVAVEAVLKVLPNLDVVAIAPPLAPADSLLLDRFAEKQAEAVWHLDAAKTLAAIEEGLAVKELTDFLSAKNAVPLPQTVGVFLEDLQRRAGQLRDLGTARLVECADAAVAQLLVRDRRLRNLCQLAGERCLVFRTSDEANVRRGLRELGYVLPPQG
jgi:hypothetical protein